MTENLNLKDINKEVDKSAKAAETAAKTADELAKKVDKETAKFEGAKSEKAADKQAAKLVELQAKLEAAEAAKAAAEAKAKEAEAAKAAELEAIKAKAAATTAPVTVQVAPTKTGSKVVAEINGEIKDKVATLTAAKESSTVTITPTPGEMKQLTGEEDIAFPLPIDGIKYILIAEKEIKIHPDHKFEIDVALGRIKNPNITDKKPEKTFDSSTGKETPLPEALKEYK